MKPLFILGGAAVVALIVLMGSRRKPKGTVARLRVNLDESLSQLESRADEMRDRARRLSGDARKKLQDQAHELEARQRDLSKRLDDLRGEARKLLDSAKS